MYLSLSPLTTGEMPTKGEKIKETVVLSVINIALPSVDIYSDLGVIIKFYVGSRRNSWRGLSRLGSLS